MNENLDAGGKHLSQAELEIEKVLRPAVFTEFSGQPKVVDNLKIFVKAARQRTNPSTMCCCTALPDLAKLPWRM